MQIALNAQLLNTSHSYRGAGVSTYCLRLVEQLGVLVGESAAVATALQFTAFVNTPEHNWPGIEWRSTWRLLQQPALRILWEQAAFPVILQQQQADLVHGLVNVLPLSTALPGIVTVHDLSFLRMPDKFKWAKRTYLTQLCRASVTKARHVIAVSRQTADDLCHFWKISAAKISVIHNGVGEEFTPATMAATTAFRQQHGLPERFFLYVGTLEPRKNLPLLLRAFARWRAQTKGENRDIALVIVGAKGWFYEQIFTLVTHLQLENAVLFPGFVPASELPDWYRAAELFIYPSLFEGFGLPVLEAMACGAPVICSDTGSLVEVVGDNALTFPAHNEDALLTCLHTITNDASLRADLQKRGLRRAQQFSWRQTAAATCTCYQTLR